MCFSNKVPDPPAAPPVPNKNAEDAQRRRIAEQQMNEAQQGRAATIITSPLGDPNFGKNIQRSTISGF